MVTAATVKMQPNWLRNGIEQSVKKEQSLLKHKRWAFAVNIRQFFISSEVKAYKPNDVFVAALDNAIRDYKKNKVILVGDSEVDIETGKN